MSDAGPAAMEVVSVSIGSSLFAIDIMSVREIRGWTPSTPLPHAPDYVRGMINLRGAVLPVVDLGALLGFGVSKLGASSVVVVVQIDGRQVGLVVDAVCDIIGLAAEELHPPPEVGSRGVRDCIRGLFSTDDGIICLLTLDGTLPQELPTAA
ncbi:chemotaxis protein CheW [Phenylobacterium sp.]|uniref:chemotaxis protein CheW n=1 Tax=Phenylobacterium sp. TaxID=1871053 RepID=UPI002EDA4FFD